MIPWPSGCCARRLRPEARAELEAVVQRYFYTPAGYQAALLMATQESDAGRHLGAALLYQQLLDTPAAVKLHDPALSVRPRELAGGRRSNPRFQVLARPLAKLGRAKIEIGGREYTRRGREFARLAAFHRRRARRRGGGS